MLSAFILLLLHEVLDRIYAKTFSYVGNNIQRDETYVCMFWVFYGLKGYDSWYHKALFLLLIKEPIFDSLHYVQSLSMQRSKKNVGSFLVVVCERIRTTRKKAKHKNFGDAFQFYITLHSKVLDYGIVVFFYVAKNYMLGHDPTTISSLLDLV